MERAVKYTLITKRTLGNIGNCYNWILHVTNRVELVIEKGKKIGTFLSGTMALNLLRNINWKMTQVEDLERGEIANS